MKDVSSSFMAWMLDPKHNPQPLAFALSRKTLEQLGRVADIKIPEEFLPVGVESVVSAQEQNSLLAVGTPEGLAEVAELAANLDLPSLQVQIEVQRVELDAEDLKVFGLRAADERATSVRAETEWQTRLDALIAAKKATLIESFQMTAIDKLASGRISTRFIPAVIGTQDSVGALTARLYLATSAGFAVLPVVNRDKSVTLTVLPFRTLQIGVDTDKPDAQSVLPHNPIVPETELQSFFMRYPHANCGAVTTIELKRNEMAAISGFTAAHFSWESEADETARERSTLLLVTARILPRFGDDETPGN